MFHDARSKKLVLVAHCVLNQNSISDGTADYAGSIKEVVSLLLETGCGIIQLPCPELHCLGLDRGDVHGAERPLLVENTRIRDSMTRDPAVRTLQVPVQSVVYQVEQYLRHGFTLLGVVGIDRSPSCGVNTTSMDNQEVRGEGVFIGALRKELEKQNVQTEWVGIKATEIEHALLSVGRIVGERR